MIERKITQTNKPTFFSKKKKKPFNFLKQKNKDFFNELFSLFSKKIVNDSSINWYFESTMEKGFRKRTLIFRKKNQFFFFFFIYENQHFIWVKINNFYSL